MVERNERGQRIEKQGGVRPGYASVLPRVFPYKKKLSREEAMACLRSLEEAYRVNFAITDHPMTIDGTVTLWLSEGDAEFLVEMGDLASVEPTKIGGRH